VGFERGREEKKMDEREKTETHTIHTQTKGKKSHALWRKWNPSHTQEQNDTYLTRSASVTI